MLAIICKNTKRSHRPRARGTLLCICGGVGREEGQFRHEVIAHPNSRRCGDGPAHCLTQGVRRASCDSGLPPRSQRRRVAAAEVDLKIRTRTRTARGGLPALTTMNPLLEPQGKRYVRWASRADLGLDRHFALWSRDPVPCRCTPQNLPSSRSGLLLSVLTVAMTQGSDLYLYELPDKPAGALGSVRPMCRAVNREFSAADIASLEFAGASDPPLQFAAGLTSGHAVVSAFSLLDAADRESDTLPKVVLTPSSRQERACNAVAWNHTHEGRLLTVLGPGGDSAPPKGVPGSHKADESALYVWDLSLQGAGAVSSLRDYLSGGMGGGRTPVSAGSDSDGQGWAGGGGGGGGGGSSRSGMACVPPGVSVLTGQNAVCDFIRDEPGCCAAWIHESAHTLVVGCPKSLRFVDIRQPKGQVNVIPSPTLLLACDPMQDTRVATYSGERADLTCKIWDWRMHARGASQALAPIQTCAVPGLWTQSLQWSPTRRGILAALVSAGPDSDTASIYAWSVAGAELEEAGTGAQNPGYPEASPPRGARAGIAASSSQVPVARRVDLGDDICCFHLHPSSPGGLLAVTFDETFKEYTLHQGGALVYIDMNPRTRTRARARARARAFSHTYMLHEGGALAFLPDGSLFTGFNYDLWHVPSEQISEDSDICQVMLPEQEGARCACIHVLMRAHHAHTCTHAQMRTRAGDAGACSARVCAGPRQKLRNLRPARPRRACPCLVAGSATPAL